MSFLKSLIRQVNSLTHHGPLTLMLHLCSLPPQALLVIFNQLSQHQVLKLAPMHSILAPIAKAKLYSYLYVYPSSQLGAKVNSLGCLEPEFRFHRNLQRLALLSHKSLQGIIIHTIVYNAAYAKAICKLRSGFPLASINWLFQPDTWDLKSLIYELVSVCSPKLPLNYVAVHFNPEYELSLPQGGFEILDANGRSIHMRLYEYYTHPELKQIFHLIKRK